MKQLILHLKSGKVSVENVPVPVARSGHVLIRTAFSLVSAGTERMLVGFGSSGWLQRAREHPDKVRQVLRKIKSDGWLPTFRAVTTKLGEPVPLGYSMAGVVVDVGPGVSGFRVGDRVAGAGPHAAYVCLSENKVAHIPANVKDQDAAFTVVGAVALQAVRLLSPTLGETVVVMGLGLTGMLAALLLKANGCCVIASEPDASKRELAQQHGILAVAPAALAETASGSTGRRGVDGVVICASAAADSLVSEAASLCRKRGRIVLAGVSGLTLNRSDFYEKELSFQVSCAYGPGRYDASYEEKGLDYPFGLVRWTMNRNFEAILELMASGSLTVSGLVTAVMAPDEAPAYYKEIGQRPGLGHMIRYQYALDCEIAAEDRHLVKNERGKSSGVVGIIGAGNFTRMALLPALKGMPIRAIASAGGVSAALLAKQYQVAYSTTDYTRILRDAEVDLVIITTRHNLHAEITLAALRAGKHVWVEKPLAIFHEQLDEIQHALAESPGTLTVGFNRRFSPYSKKARQLIGGTPVNIIATMNAGSVDPGSWLHDRAVGGGRVLGEACHLIDLVSHLAGSPICEVCASYQGQSPSVTDDNVTVLLKLANGSAGTIHYFSNGNPTLPKERITVHGGGKTLVLDDFKKLTGYGYMGFSSMSGPKDKGHTAQLRELIGALKNGDAPLMQPQEILNVSRAALAAYDSFTGRQWVRV